MTAESIRVRGIVQGVGFRPTVWRLARECGLTGEVWNDASGVMIHAWGSAASLQEFAHRLHAEQPPLSRIESIDRAELSDAGDTPQEFRIVDSRVGEVRTVVPADAAACDDCMTEVMDPSNRRYRYPFTNCTHCGPRLSIIRDIPYDRAKTSMASFPMCTLCQAEYEDPADRRFHAQPNACADCGPLVWLEDATGRRLEINAGDDAIKTAAELIGQGKIVAIKGIGGVHLACDAANETAVEELRRRKHRYHKAFALMAKDVEMVARYTSLSETETKLLKDTAAPIVVLDAVVETLATSISPGQNTLGFMLPYTPLHHLLMQDMQCPVVLTSGNRSEEPQTISNGDARQRLAPIADYFLLHDRDIVNRLDDSVLRVMDGQSRFLRRARGYAPRPIHLPDDFDGVRNILAMGGELKNTFCLLGDGKAILSQHMGDLEDASTQRDYRHHLKLYRQLFDFNPEVIAVDMHPDYLSTKLGKAMAAEEGLELVEVQHHHAHIAGCMAEHGLPLNTDRVLGIALDGLGYGDDGSIWGGEFLLADYSGFERLAYFQPAPMLGGAQAMREPWRNTLAQMLETLGWEQVREQYPNIEITSFIANKPLNNLVRMSVKGLNSPMASSAGRLFDAVAAAVGVCRETAGFEGQAAMELEVLASEHFSNQTDCAYGFEFREGMLCWTPLWSALLKDIADGVSAGVIAARFHHGLAFALADTTERLRHKHEFGSVVLSGGVFQNRLLLEQTATLLRKRGFNVLIPMATPANDGGLSLGQAVVALVS